MNSGEKGRCRNVSYYYYYYYYYTVVEIVLRYGREDFTLCGHLQDNGSPHGSGLAQVWLCVCVPMCMRVVDILIKCVLPVGNVDWYIIFGGYCIF